MTRIVNQKMNEKDIFGELTAKIFNIGDIVEWSTWNREADDWNSHYGIVIDIKNEEVKKIILEHSDNDILSVSKKNKIDENFVIDNLPKDEIPKSDLIADFLGYFLTQLVFEDVFERKQVINENILVNTQFELFNNVLIRATVFKDNDIKWINFDIDDDSLLQLKNDNLIEVNDINNWTYKLLDTKYNTLDTRLKDLLVED